MIPILYRPDENQFLSNGIGRLYDCYECTVTEERNGIFECEFKYPITGRFYNTMINEGGVVGVIHDDKGDIQPFDIYSYSAPIDGVVTFFAHHISYRLANVIVRPFEASSCALAINGLKTNSLNQNDFSFWTNKDSSGTFSVTVPQNVRALLGGQSGSILDAFGKGDYQFDNFEVKLYTNRGVDSGVTIRYGKNLSDIKRDYDKSGTYNAVAPYWANGDQVVTLSDYIVAAQNVPSTLSPWTYDNGDFMTDENGEIIYFDYVKIVPFPLDLSSEFSETPTDEQLRQRALEWLNNNEPWVPDDNIEVDFVQLWQTPEYESIAALQRVSLCDTVAIYYPELGVTNASAKVIKTVYNVLAERFDSMELGTPKVNFDAIMKETVDSALKDVPDVTEFEAIVNHASDLITGGLGGHIVMTPNADGEPQEILIMDTDSVDTAINVIRMNKNGIGFSHNGYQGPYTSAWTIDGKFNADFIAAGTLLASYIKGGTLTLGGLNNTFGSLSMLNRNGLECAKWDAGGMRISGGFQINSSFYSTDQNYIEQNGSRYYSDLGRNIIEFEFHEIANNVDFGNTEIGARGIDGDIKDSSNNQYRFHFTPLGLSIRKNSEEYLEFDFGYWGLTTSGNFSANGSKSRVVNADDFGKRLLYCYETPSPLFGDIGEGVIDETGTCYVFLDAVFAETITTDQYQVFLQRYGEGDCYVAERKADYFVVHGEPGLAFGWELKAKQKDFDQLRLERQPQKETETSVDYGEEAANYYFQLEEERTA